MLQLRKTALLIGLTMLATLGLTATPGRAQTSAVTLTGGTTETNRNLEFSGGYEFTTNSAISVSALGFFTADGTANFVDDHPLALYTSTGTLLATSDVSSSNFSFINGNFVYTLLSSPVTLAAGGDFIVTGASGETDAYNYNSVVTTDPRINYIENRYGFNGGASFPDQTGGGAGTGYFGASFGIGTLSAVPEPSSYAVFAFAALGLGGLMLKARKRKGLNAA